MNRKLKTIRCVTGFSLLEVLVALTIFALTLGGLSGVFSGGLNNAYVAERYALAGMIGTSKLAALGTEIPLMEGESVGEEPGGYAWTVKIAPYPEVEIAPDSIKLYRVDIVVRWRDDLARREVTLTTLEVGPKK